MNETLDYAEPSLRENSTTWSIAAFNRICYAIALLWIGGALLLSLRLNVIEKGGHEYHDFSQFYMGGLVARHHAWDALYPVPHADSVNSPGEWEESDTRPAYRALADEAGVPEESSRYIQPPPFALSLEPLAYLRYPLAKKSWNLLMVLCAWGVAVMAGKSYEAAARRRSPVAGPLALLVAISPLTLDTLRLMNLTPLIALLIGFSVFGLLCKHSEGGAVALVAGAAAKYATAVLLPLYVAMRKWRALVVMAVLTAAIVAGSLAVMKTGPFVEFFHLSKTFGRVHTDSWNRSLPALLMHVANRHGDPKAPLHGAWLVASQLVQWGSLAAILAILFTRKREFWLDPSHVLAAATALLCWFLIFSPILWDHYFLYLVPLWGWVAWEGRRSWLPAAVAAFVILYPCLPDFVIEKHVTRSITLAGPYECGMLATAVVMLLLAVWRLVSPAARSQADAQERRTTFSFTTRQFNRACAATAALWLVVSIAVSLHHAPGDEDFPQFYMGGLMARLHRYDSLYPIPKPGSLNNAGLPEDSVPRPAYAQEAKRHLVRDGAYFIQPPPVALGLEPLSLMSYGVAFRGWLVLSIACAWGVACIAGAGYQILRGRPTPMAGVIVLLVACSPLMHHAIRVANMSVLVALTIGLAVLELVRRREPAAAAVIVLGGVLKYATAPLLPLVVVMRRWTLLAWVMGLSALLAVAAFLVMGPAPFKTYLTEIFPTLSRTHHLETNQSLTGFLIRILHRDVLPAGIKLAALAAQGLVLIGLLFLLVRQRVSAWRRPANVFAAAMMLVAFMLVFSPISWEHYPVYLCPMWGWLLWEGRRNGWVMALAVVAIGLVYVPFTSLLDTLREPFNSHMLPSNVLMMAVGAWRVSRTKEADGAEPRAAAIDRLPDLVDGPHQPGAARGEALAASPALAPAVVADGGVAKFNRLCRVAAAAWLLVGIPLSFKLRPPRFFDFAQFYMGGVMARHGAWDALYPVPKPDSLYNPGLPPDSDMRPRYAELAEQTGVGNEPRFIQPPPAAMALEPLAFLRYRRAYWVWVMLQCTCALGVALLAGKFYALAAGRPDRIAGIATLGAAASYLLYQTLRALNLEATLTLLMALAILDLATARKRTLAGAAGGIALAAGAMLKYVSLILLPLVVAARRWSAAAGLLVFGLIAVAGTLCISGTGPFREFLRLSPLLARPYELDPNQSLTGFLLRTTHQLPLAASIAWSVRLGGAAILIGIVILIFRRPAVDWRRPPMVFAAAAALIGWALIFSPLTWNKYFVYLIPLWGWMAWEATQSRWRLAIVALALAGMWGAWEEVERLDLREPLLSHMLWAAVLVVGLAVSRLTKRSESPPADPRPSRSPELEGVAGHDDRAVLPDV